MQTETRRTRSAARTLFVAGAVVAASSLALAGCAGASAESGGPAGSDGPTIVTTTTQVGDFTRELAGDQAEVTQLLQPGQSAHSFDPSAAQLSALASADALVISGAGLESWIDDAVSASGFDGVLIDASEGIETHGTDEHDHAEDQHAEDEHDHAEGNPHIWTDPALAATMVTNIAAGLADVEGIDATELDAHEAAYEAKLQTLSTWITDNVDIVPADQRLLVTNHDAFTYFVDAYDITFVGSVMPSFDDNAEPSAAEIDELVAQIKETGVKAVFSESSISPKTADTIASEAGVKVYSGEDALYGDSLGAEGTEGETYVGSQIHNVRLILESWGVTATEPPAGLEG